MTRRFAKLMRVVVLTPILLPLIAVATLLVLLLLTARWVRMVLFCTAHRGERYLICSRRQGWEPFLCNNVIPVLPEHIRDVWYELPDRFPKVLKLIRSRGITTSKPFLAVVTPLGVRSVPLNDRLHPLKASGRRADDVRREVERVLESALAVRS